MQIFDFTVAVGKVADIYANGRYVYYYSGTAGGADSTITLREDTTGTSIVLLPGQAFRIPDEQKTANRWMIGNYAGAGTIKGRLVIGSGALDDNRVTGSVEIIDGGKNRSLAGGTFALASVVGPFSVSQFSGTMLYNPSTTVNVVINQVAASTDTTGLIYGIIAVGAPPYGTGASSGGKRAGGPVSIAQKYEGATTTIPTAGNVVLFTMRLITNTPTNLVLTEPIVLPPNTWFGLFTTLPQTALTTQLQFFEEAI